MASVTLPRTHDSETAQVLEDLVRESLLALLPVSVCLAWLWLAVMIVADSPQLGQGYVVLALLVGAAAAGSSLQRKRLKLAGGVFLSSITASVTVIAWAAQSATMFYLYGIVVLVAAVLTQPRTMWGVTVGSVALVLAVGCGVHGMPLAVTASIIAFLLLAALTAWLSSRRLYTALTWALNMTSAAQKSAADAQERRAEVRSMLKSLDEAYWRLERANEALIYAREAAERAYRFKAEFVANVSHELRTPLNLIIGFSEMVATAPESYKGMPLPSEYRGDVLAIYRSARHLADLINDVLDLSQVEAGRLGLEREPADLGGVIHEAVEIVRGLAEAKGLRLEVEVPDGLPRLRLDRTRIRQVLLNLLTNATRFTEEGCIRVQARMEPQEVRVTVEDSGHGIAQEKIDRAFEAFSQLHDGEVREGSGLGLAVSKRFVELHGGTMWIESALGRGTTVGFALPTPGSGREAPVALLKASRLVPAQEAQPWVLVLHDDAQGVGLLRRYVEGYQFAAAHTVQEACALVEEATPAAVILEPGWAGRWAEVAVRSRLPAEVAVLTCPLPGLRHLAHALGAAEYLTKPVTREQLLAALSRLPGPSRKVLVVDDDPNFVRLVTRVLKAHDASIGVLEASGGEEGLALLRAQRPDVVLLDLLMPEVSGYDLLVEMKRDEALAKVPVIILSARGLEDETAPLAGELQLARSGGFTPGQVVEVIQALLPAISRQGSLSRV
jgi:signal transduction histidine kinase/DNA-binding response OmpR family regulator